MPNLIQIKRREQPGAIGAPPSLFSGELAFNANDATLYVGIGTSGPSGTASTIAAIAGAGAFVALVGNQTIDGVKTFVGPVDLGLSATAATPLISDNSTAVATTAFVRAYATSVQLAAGAGLVKDGNTLNIGVAGGETARLVVTADAIDLANTGVTPGAYSVVSVDQYGRVLSGDNPTTLTGHGIVDGQKIITANGVLKGTGDGNVTAATKNVDFQDVILSSGVLKGSGAGNISSAMAGTDYLAPDSVIDGGFYS